MARGFPGPRDVLFGSLEQVLDLTCVIEADGFGGRFARQAGHGHDLTADHHDKAGTGTQADLTHRNGMTSGRATQGRISREGILRLRHADRQVAISRIFPLAQLVADLVVSQNLVSAIDALGDPKFDSYSRKSLILLTRKSRCVMTSDF